MSSFFNFLIPSFIIFFPFFFSTLNSKNEFQVSFGIFSYWFINILIAFYAELIFPAFNLSYVIITFNLLLFIVILFNIKKNLQFFILENIYKFLFLVIIFLLTIFFLSDYTIYAWDEFAKILFWSKSIFVSKNIYNEFLSSYVSGDNPGLPILFSLPSLIFNQFSEKNLVLVYFSIHFALICFLFESLNKINKNINLNILFILVFLVLEISWKVIPENLLYENIQIYLFSCIFIMSFLFHDKVISRQSFFVYLLLLSLFAYLIKSSFITLLPIILIYMKILKLSNKNIFIFLISFFIVHFSISTISSESRCQTNPLLNLSLYEFDIFYNLVLKVLNKIFLWLVDWKQGFTFFLLIISVILSYKYSKVRILYFLFFLWFLVYFLAIILLMKECFTNYELENLFAVERYFIIIFRSFHIITLFILFYYLFNKLYILNKFHYLSLNSIFISILIFQIFVSINQIKERKNISIDYKTKLIKFKQELNNDNYPNLLNDKDKSLYLLLKKYHGLKSE